MIHKHLLYIYKVTVKLRYKIRKRYCKNAMLPLQIGKKVTIVIKKITVTLNA